ncbi:MAG: phosphotransferase, partial [Candidatus Woesebacteria bacterium]|nr:phosphotransferase [Candidatus Woesebacteria bacterium]
WENKEMFKIDEAYLLHGDFGPKHLLIVDNHVTGILDFEGAKGGDPIRDLAWLNFFYGDSFSIDWLKVGYKNKDIFDENFDLKMKLYRLHLGLDLLEYYESEKNKSGMIHTRERFIKELENF